MTKVNQNNTNTNETEKVAVTGTTANVVAIGAPPLSRMARLVSSASIDLAEKAKVRAEIVSDLTQAASLYGEGSESETLGAALADKAGTKLYQARISGLFNADEVSSLLGERFGYAPKQDGTDGKTPAGAGGAIRKRIVRAVQARDYALTGEGTAFFDGLDKDAISDVVTAIDNGGSIWTAYEAFGKIKKEGAVKVALAFDPRRIAAIAADLRQDGAVTVFAGSVALQEAYLQLVNAINFVDTQELPSSKAA